MFRSLRWRMTGWYVLLLACVLVIFSGATFFAVDLLLLDAFDQVLVQRALVIAQVVDIDDNELELDQESLYPYATDEHFTRLYRSDATVIYDDTNTGLTVRELQDAVHDALRGHREITEVRMPIAVMRIVTVPITEEGRIVGVLQVGTSLESIENTLYALRIVLLVLTPLTLLLASGGGLLLANWALAPIDHITQTAQRISAEDLSNRIGLRDVDDEVGRLAQTFNMMLGRLEFAFKRQRQFTADASHELRTPLTAIIGHLDVTLERPRSEASYRTTLLAVREQARRLARLANDMLYLARTDEQRPGATVEPVDLSELLQELIAQTHDLAAARRQTLTFTRAPGMVVHGDEDQLRRLIMNVLDNAIYYTPPGGRIAVECASNSESSLINITDSGPGIAPEHMQNLFERFYRVDGGRHRAQGGAGLGLAIAQNIAHLHGGQITVESVVGQGSTFTIRLPKSL